MADITKRAFSFAKKETYSHSEVEDLINQNDNYNQAFTKTMEKDYQGKVKEAETKYRTLEIEAIELPKFKETYTKLGGKPEGLKRFFNENQETWDQIKTDDTKIVEFVTKAREDQNNKLFFNDLQADVTNKFTKGLTKPQDETQYLNGTIYKVPKR